MVQQVRGRESLRPAGHREEEVDGIFHRLEVADIEHPESVHAICVCKLELLPHVLYGSDVQPLGVAGSADVIDVVVDAPASLAAAFLSRRELADVAPVIVAEEYGHVIGNAQSEVVILLDFLVQGPDLRPLLSRAAGLAAYDPALVVDDSLEQFDVISLVAFLAQRRVAVAAHTYRYQVLGVLCALHSFREEAVQDLPVGLVVPLPFRAVLAHPFLMVARHGLVVRCTH